MRLQLHSMRSICALAYHNIRISGGTDLRKSIDGLVNVLTYTYNVNPYLTVSILFLFIGNTKYTIKGLVMENDGAVLISNRLKTGKLTWNTGQESGLPKLSYEEFSHLMNYGTIEKAKQYAYMRNQCTL